MNIQKLSESLRVFDFEARFFVKFKKKFLLYSCFVWDPDVILKEMDRNFPLEVYLDTKITEWIVVLQFPKSLDYMQFYMTLLDLWNLLRKKDLIFFLQKVMKKFCPKFWRQSLQVWMTTRAQKIRICFSKMKIMIGGVANTYFDVQKLITVQKEKHLRVDVFITKR